MMVCHEWAIKMITNYFIKFITMETRPCLIRLSPACAASSDFLSLCQLLECPDHFRTFAQAVLPSYKLFLQFFEKLVASYSLFHINVTSSEWNPLTILSSVFLSLKLLVHYLTKLYDYFVYFMSLPTEYKTGLVCFIISPAPDTAPGTEQSFKYLLSESVSEEMYHKVFVGKVKS